MRAFDYSHIPDNVRDNGVCNLVSDIREYRGRQGQMLSGHSRILKDLQDETAEQSAAASCRLAGIEIPPKRFDALMTGKAIAQGEGEAQILNYCNLMITLHTNEELVPCNTTNILRFHRNLFTHRRWRKRHGEWTTYESYKERTDRKATETASTGFRTTPAANVHDAVRRLCLTFRQARKARVYDELLLIPLFILDFLCLRPFDDGNGRLSRIMATALLRKAGYSVGFYVPLEALVEESKDEYGEALRSASIGWEEGANDPKPFVRFFLQLVLKAYKSLKNKIELGRFGKIPKPAKICRVIDDISACRLSHGGYAQFTKHDIMREGLKVSETTVERTLKDLLDAGLIRKRGGGRGTKYLKVNVGSPLEPPRNTVAEGTPPRAKPSQRNRTADKPLPSTWKSIVTAL